MKFGLGFPVIKLYPPTVQPWEEAATSADVVRIAQTAEEVGFDYLGVSDHIFMTVEMAKLMGGRWCEGVTTITFLAGATKRIQVYNSVLVLPYRDPVILAKQMATLDFLSGGRSILGIGIGHLEKEFEVLKVPRAERGPMSDEYLEAIKILWTEERPEFHGKYVEFDDIVFEPRPVAKPHPPIWIGGNTKPAMRRAAKYGDGWVPWQITPDQLPEALDYLKSRPEFAERPRPFDVVMPAVFIQREEGTQRELGETRIPDSADEWLEAVGANRDAGATATSLSLGHTKTVDHFIEKLHWFAEEVIAPSRG